MILGYCDKCGSIVEIFQSDIDNNTPCWCCGNFPQIPVPKEYIDNFRWRDGDGEEAFIEEVIKKSPNLDPYLFEHKDEIIDAQNAELDAAMERGRAIPQEKNRTAHCPVCNSTNLSRITLTTKAVKIFAFGIFGMGDNGKTWKCNNCGSKF